MPSISVQFALLTLHLEVAWVYVYKRINRRAVIIFLY